MRRSCFHAFTAGHEVAPPPPPNTVVTLDLRSRSTVRSRER
jgi:hypothetical protein